MSLEETPRVSDASVSCELATKSHLCRRNVLDEPLVMPARQKRKREIRSRHFVPQPTPSQRNGQQHTHAMSSGQLSPFAALPSRASME